MRFVDRSLTPAVRRACIGLMALSTSLFACSEGFEPLSHAAYPAALSVQAVRAKAVRLSWSRVDGADVIGYTVERRANLSGAFAPIGDQIPQTSLDSVSWIDTDVDPETFYGYRVYAVTRFGDRSRASVVGGAKTPPMPGVDVSTTSVVPSSDAADQDGYDIMIVGPDTIHATIGVSQRRRFNPLRPGRYDVTLSGIAARCAVDGSATQSVDVTDTTATTIVPVAFHITCRDPNRGDINVTLAATGDNVDPEYTISVIGEAADATLPDAERIFSQSKTTGPGSPVAFPNLRPGTYDVTLKDLAGNCQLQGAAKRTVQVAALGNVPVGYSVTCVGDGPGPSTRPFTWRNRWSSATAAPGQHVTLTAELDVSSLSTQKVQGVQADIVYDPAVLQFDHENAGQLPNLTVNATSPGHISFLAATSSPRSGVVKLAEFDFVVIGAEGATTTTATSNVKAGSPTPFQSDVGVQEGKLTVGVGVANQPPVAEANGPYAGTTTAAVSFSGAGSSDSDGTIASYAWNFGDNATGTGQSASHTYAAAGSYTVTLTVTDNTGATDTDQATVTITSGAPANTPPTAAANGPYSATVGVPVTLSSAGSTDANGSIASYSWALGDGQTATGASPSVTYPTAGTYTATLTVTDNNGATDTDQATVVVSTPANIKPLLWRAVFGPIDVVNNVVSVTVSYDLRTNISETPGVEVLAGFVVDSLKWDPSILQFSSINLGPNVVGSSNQANVSAGNIGFHGTTSGALAQGLITIATIRFKLVGPAGSRVTTSTFLGTVQGASSTNNFVYNPKTTITEGEIILP